MVFSDYSTLQLIFTESSLHALPALNNKEVTLTQSQMLKTPDYAQFVNVQASEIRGLEKMGVLKYHPIQNLPPHSRLLSSIWS